jgi:hypothetical protein
VVVYRLRTENGGDWREYTAVLDVEDSGNDYVRGQRAWLLNFDDGKIDLPGKMCDPGKATGVRPVSNHNRH